jgi:hypothetical protein
MVRTVETWINRQYAEVGLYLSDVGSTVRDFADDTLSGITTLYDDVSGSLTRLVDESVEGVVGGLKAVGGYIAELPATLADISASLTQALSDHVGTPIASLGVKTLAAVTEALSTLWTTLREILGKMLERTLRTIGVTDGGISTFQNIVNGLAPDSPFIGSLVTLVICVYAVLPFAHGVASYEADLALQEYRKGNPHELMPIGDTLNLWRRGLIGEEQARDTVARNGYSATDTQALMNGSLTLPPEGEIITWWLRGFISREELVTALRHKGWEESNIDKLSQAAYFIPGVGDLVQMAVREAFTPEIAERFGQYEDFPPDFSRYAQEQGVSEDWARRYWAAHWALPSLEMGYEMLHRGIIDSDTLKLLMRAHDVMPFWRDKLVALSFNPLTRVDVRRMHKMGVLTTEEVTQSYRNIGYSDIDAQRMTEFTVQYNQGEPDTDADEIRTMTKGEVLEYYESGVIGADKTSTMLVNLGYSLDAAQAYIAAIDGKLDRETRKAQTNDVIDEAVSGIMSWEAAQSKLSGMGLTAAELERAMSTLNTRRTKANTLPSRADLDRMVKAGLVDQTEYLDVMARHGYAKQWAIRYYTLAQVV